MNVGSFSISLYIVTVKIVLDSKFAAFFFFRTESERAIPSVPNHGTELSAGFYDGFSGRSAPSSNPIARTAVSVF